VKVEDGRDCDKSRSRYSNIVRFLEGGLVREIESGAKIFLGPDMSVQIIDRSDDYTDTAGLAAVVRMDGVWTSIDWFRTEDLEIADVSDIDYKGVDGFVQKIREMAERNGCQFIEPDSNLKKEIDEIRRSR